MPAVPPPPAVPGSLLAHADRGPAWAHWLDGLPHLLADVLGEWALVPDGDATSGGCALVVPVRTEAGVRAVLTLTFPHPEAETEHLALRRWGGLGAVELLRADPHRFALLLERLTPRDLHTVPVDEAVATVAGLYPRLHVPALAQPRRLSDELRRWSAGLLALPRAAPVPRRYVERALSLARALADDDATDARLLHGDLHYGTVLAGLRAPWLAVGPRPLSGDPAFEVAPLLWHRWSAALATGDLRGALRRRLDLACDVGGLDPDRARAWVLVRTMVTALQALTDAAARGAQPDRDWLTRQVTLAKAVQD